MRKTWLALQLGIAVATGGRFLEWSCDEGEVLMLALEDNERRLRSRIRTLQTFNMAPPDLSGFRYWTGGMSVNASGQLYLSDPHEAAETMKMFPRGEEGVDALEQYLEQFPKTTVIVIDTLKHFRGPSNNRDIYERDYEAMMPITKLAARKQVLIMPVTHDKKGLAGNDSADFMEDVTGSAGNTGGSDGVLSIKGRRGVQDENESRKLYISGRDVPHDFEIDMTFDAERGGWLPAARQDVKVALRSLFERHPYINQQELAALLPNVAKARITKVLTTMKFEGEIVSTKFGYALNRQ
jgi:RecA-family ATPase